MKKFLKIRETVNNNHHNTNNTEILDGEGYLLFPKGGGDYINELDRFWVSINCWATTATEEFDMIQEFPFLKTGGIIMS